MDNINIETVGLFASKWVFGATLTAFVLLIFGFYIWGCHIIGDYAKERGSVYRTWFLVSVFCTPLFAPSLYFYTKGENYFSKVAVAPVLGISFSFFYIPYKMMKSLIRRAIK